MMNFRCVVCGEFSLKIVCDKCKSLITPKVEFKDNVVSFYDYDEVEYLLKYKYHKFGSRVINYLCKPLLAFKRNFKEKAYIIPIDDNPKKGFSHTAIIAKNLKSSYLKPIFGSLRAMNNIKYAGKSLDFRLKNKKEFIYNGLRGIDVILVDDIYTTGSTINQAIEVLKENDVNILFSIVLARKG